MEKKVDTMRKEKLIVLKGISKSYDGEKVLSEQFFTEDGSCLALRLNEIIINSHLSAEIPHAEGIAEGQAEAFAGVGGKAINQLFERNDAGFNELGVHPRECEIDSRDTKRALFKTAALLLCGVGRVVGCDHFESAVKDALDECLSVRRRTEGRIHLESAFLAKVGVVHY